MNGISLLLATQVKNPVSKPCCFCFLSKSQIHPLFHYYCLNLMLWFTAQIHIQDQGTHSLQLLGCHLVMAHSWIPSNQQFVSVKEAALLKITSSSQGQLTSNDYCLVEWYKGLALFPQSGTTMNSRRSVQVPSWDEPSEDLFKFHCSSISPKPDSSHRCSQKPPK